MSASQASAGVTLTVCNGGTHACHEANGSPALTIVVAPRDNSASAPVTEVSTSAWQAGDWHLPRAEDEVAALDMLASGWTPPPTYRCRCTPPTLSHSTPAGWRRPRRIRPSWGGWRRS